MVCKALIPLMKEQNFGRVVNVSSRTGGLRRMGSGFPAYRISKTALNALTRIFATELKETNILINSACPGPVKTDMPGATGSRTVEQGADTIVWLATLKNDGPTGGFFKDRKPIPW
jgi:NAD(P)-dependent dehydrogenase (short-subunit alcohol dehydrogenase family)